MILHLGYNRSSLNHSYLICLGAAVDEPAFMTRAKVKPGTYAGDLVANVYDAIFRRSLELKREYLEYYAVEYTTFSDFLHRRFMLKKEAIAKLSAEYSRCCQMIYFHSSYCFLEDDYGRDFLESLLEPNKSA
jgi:hypothetical protein